MRKDISETHKDIPASPISQTDARDHDIMKIKKGVPLIGHSTQSVTRKYEYEHNSNIRNGTKGGKN
jgi:hypothetical protein